MRRLDALLGALAVLSMVLFLVAAAALGASWRMTDSMPVVTPEPVAVIEIPAREPCGSEDGPSWNWAMCGNLKRGVVLLDGRHVVVTCGDFRWLIRHHRLRLRETPVFLGDSGCGRANLAHTGVVA
jgi:hypothetical protein